MYFTLKPYKKNLFDIIIKYNELLEHIGLDYCYNVAE